MTEEVSPLQRFVSVKKDISQIFNEIFEYLQQVKSFSETGSEFVEGTDLEHLITSSLDQIETILTATTRDSMKVAFFGRTSNGKSTVINTLLSDKILPSGIGHTTSCFVSMQGTDLPEPYILIQDSNEKKSVSNLKQLASALNDESLDPSSSIQLYWPVSRCPILAHDVVLIDSPGVDVSPDLDTWIDKYCFDADVFVLVTNAESTLNNAEKQFFHKVNQRISKPNIFILNNRWDASALEPDDMNAVRSQHTERGIDFLAKELACVTKNEAHNRIFFTSARESLSHRIAEKEGLSTNQVYGYNLVGHDERIQEFVSFEIAFQKCLSNSAIVTKFEAKSFRGLQIIDSVILYLDNVIKNIDAIRTECQEKISEINKKCFDKDEKLASGLKHSESQIHHVVQGVFTKVHLTMCEEVNLIYNLINSFERHFHDDPSYIEAYKNDMVMFVEKGLEKNVFERCDKSISKMVYRTQKSIVALTKEILNGENGESDLSTVTKSPNMSNSLFPSSIPKERKSKPRKKSKDENSLNAIKNLEHHESQQDLTSVNTVDNINDDGVNPQMIHAVGLMTSTTSALLLVSLGMAWRFIGPKFIAGISGIYGSIYGYERITWTNSAKEKTYKRQFSQFITKKLNYAVKIASLNCSKQIERLDSAYTIANRFILESKKMTRPLEEKIKKCQNHEMQAQTLRYLDVAE